MARPPAKRLPKVTRVQLAAILGASLRTIGTLEATGVLTPSRRGRGGRPSLYDLTEAVPAFIEHERKTQGQGFDDKDARSRRDLAQARFTELKIQRQEGSLVELEEVTRQGAAYTKAWATQVRSLPRRAVLNGVIGQKSEAALAALCRDVLTEISQWNLAEVEEVTKGEPV